MTDLSVVRARIDRLSESLRTRGRPQPMVQIFCEVCGGLANRGRKALYCSDHCKQTARDMRAAGGDA